MKPLQIKANTPVFEEIFPFVFSTILAISMPIIFLIASEWSLVAVLICWLYASNSPSAVHPTLFFLGKEIYALDYSEYNRFRFQWAKWKSNIQAILLEKYHILILKIWNKNEGIIFSFYLLQMKEAICKKKSSIHPEYTDLLEKLKSMLALVLHIT